MGGAVVVDNEAIEFVAEHVIGFKRRQCDGLPEGSDRYRYCQWCGRLISPGEDKAPCPAYPFPAFSFIDLMRMLGERYDMPITIDFNPLREKKRFVIITNSPVGRICDTDTPLESLCDYLWNLSEGVE